MEMFGTKWPSMTSTWIQSAPAASTARTSSPSLAKSAARIDGAMMSGRCTLSLQINVRVTRRFRTGNGIGTGPAKLAGERGVAADSRLFQPPACKKNRCFLKVCATASVLHRWHRTRSGSALRVQEYFMSVSVNGSNANNPYALWQSLLQPGSSARNSAQSDPIASLLAALGQGQGSATGATAPSAGSSSTSSAVTSGSSSPQFDAQTLQTMFDMQANPSNSQPVQPPLDGSTGSDDSFSSQQVQQSQPGHHHHHHAGGANDGSTAAPTTAAPSDGSTSPATSNTAGGANVAQNNLLERLIQMQAQLNPATAQNVATA